MNRKGFGLVPIILIVAVVLVAGGIWYYEARQIQSPTSTISLSTSTSSSSTGTAISITPSSSQSSPTSVTSTASTPIVLTSEMQGDPLGLFLANYPDSNGISYELNDGVINSGTYAGYQRIIAAYAGIGYSYYTFATKNFKTFIYDSTSTSDLAMFDRSKVMGIGSIPSNFPVRIDEGAFALINSEAANEDQIATGSTVLPVNFSGATFYSEPLNYNEDTSITAANQADPINPTAYQQWATASHEYLFGDTSVQAEDSNGLIYDYHLYPRESVSRFVGSDTDEFFLSSDFRGGSNTYNTYSQILGGGCGGNYVTDVLKDISASDLISFTTTLGGIELYALENPNHPLNQASYYADITGRLDTVSQMAGNGYGAYGQGGTAQQQFQEANGVSPPTYQQYIAKTPILIFKDPWGRYVGVGENDYQTPFAGCK